MIKLDDIYGFPVCKNEKDGTIEIDSNCEYPQQSEECENLYQSIEYIAQAYRFAKHTIQLKLLSQLALIIGDHLLAQIDLWRRCTCLQ